jgi:hypothetical protein
MPLCEVDQNAGGRRSARTRVVTEKAKALTPDVSDAWLVEALGFLKAERLGKEWIAAIDSWEKIERKRGPIWAPKPAVRSA